MISARWEEGRERERASERASCIMGSWAPTITTLSASTVAPSSSTPPHRMFLASIDIVWRWFHYNQRILFFKLQNPNPSFVAHLKSSLALALVDFFPWAGRLVEQANGRLALDCTDAGVPFIESSIDVPFSSLEADGFQHKPFFTLFAPHSDVRQWNPELPLLSVQVTRFPGDEGFVLGIGHNHTVADGTSLWHFIKSWGECALGLPISIHPLHMREALAPEKLILPPAPPDDKASARSITQGGIFNISLGVSELLQRDFHFSSEMVRKLKHMSISSAPEGHAPFSSLQALSAHIWRHVVAARGLDKSRNTAFFLIANMRPKCVPPLPDAYFGNAILRDAAIALTQELQEESLGRTAMRIQELIKSLDDTYMKTSCGNLEVLDPDKLLEGFDFSMPMLQLSSSPRFPVYDVDFGWGPPLCVRCPLIRTDGEMVWFAGREGGGSVDVSLSLSKHVMEKLEQDEDFQSVHQNTIHMTN